MPHTALSRSLGHRPVGIARRMRTRLACLFFWIHALRFLLADVPRSPRIQSRRDRVSWATFSGSKAARHVCRPRRAGGCWPRYRRASPRFPGNRRWMPDAAFDRAPPRWGVSPRPICRARISSAAPTLALMCRRIAHRIRSLRIDPQDTAGRRERDRTKIPRSTRLR